MSQSDAVSLVGTSNELATLLYDNVPMDHVDFAFAYGSGVFKQGNNGNTKDNMADYTLVVSDSKAFHAANLRANGWHYSFVKYLGSDWLSRLQRNYGAQVYFNTLVRTKCGRFIKYGIIDVEDLRDDLLDWHQLYIAGRLHKPVLYIKSPDEKFKDLSTALEMNLKCAVHSALLLLPETFDWRDFFKKVTSLSYRGDFRTIIGEDRNKINNIVDGNFDRFTELYKPLLLDTEQLHIGSKRLEQDVSSVAVHHNLQLLPRHILWRMQNVWSGRGKLKDLEEAIFIIAQHREYSSLLNESLMSTVRSSSIRQTFKNMFTAGIRKSVAYSSRKMLKMIKSLVR